MSSRGTGVRAGGETRSRARSLALWVGSLLVIAAGFAIYLWFQPDMPAVTHHEQEVLTPAAHSTASPNTGPINSGKGVWVKSYGKDGRLASQFRTVQYDPQRDNTIHVTRPEAQFFLAHDQVLRITGREGVVVTQGQLGGGESFGKAPQQTMPTKGRLEDVKLELFDAPEAAKLLHEQPARPTLTVAMNNAVFDSDTFRIYTDDYTEAGKTVAGADVPVTVTGDDYEFQGWGLLIRWNERTSQLELLEVARGDHLTIKHPGMLASPGSGLGMLSMRGGRLNPAWAKTLPGMLASADPAAAGEILRQKHSHAQPQTRRAAAHSPSRPQPTYRADFDRAVRIVQSGQVLATANAMQVDFLPKSEPAKEPATAQPPATRPSTAPARSATSHPLASAPTSRPAPAPITIHWTGKLRVTPIEPKPDERIAPGQAAVRLFGAPVVLKQAGSTLQSAVALFRTADSSLLLTSTPRTPVSMRDATGATVTTESMLFRQDSRVAELTGKGEARGLVRQEQAEAHPAAAAAPKQGGQLDARWEKKATIHFAGTTQNDMTIAEALLEGAVSVNHPQLQLKADSLDLLFGDEPDAARMLLPFDATKPPHAAQGDLRHVFARGNVRADLIDAKQDHQHIESDRLAVTMATGAQGTVYPALFGAEGHVYSVDKKQNQELRCDWLQVAMGRRSAPPADDESGETNLENLLAGGGVRISDGTSHAEAQRLAVAMVEGQPRVTLSGTPATISDPHSRLSGPVIVYAPHDKHASVRGPGTLHAMQAATHDTPARPMDAQWTDGIEVDGARGRIDLTGQVVTTSTDPDGARQTARGDRLTLLLAPTKVATRPAIQAKAAATRPAPVAGLFSGQDNFLADQTVEAAWFEGNAKLESAWSGPGGQLLRRLYLSAPSVRYSIPRQRLLVPTAGKMLVEDHRKPEPKAADAKDRPPAARGTTAFQWNKQLTFDQTRHEATMVGDVVIVHEPQPGTGERGFQMRARQVTAELAPANPQSSHATTEPSTRSAEPRVQLKRLTAEGLVHVQSGTNQIDAQTIAFDPETGLLTAKGTQAAPVQLTGAASGSHGSFVTLVYDLKNDRIVSMTGAQFRGNP